MTNLATRLQDVRTHRSRVNVMYQSVAAPVQLSGKMTGSVTIKMAYEQADREEYAIRFKRILDSLDRQEQEILARMEEVSA